LRLPAPSPGADLGRRIKDQIPEDVFASSAQTERRENDSPSRHDARSIEARRSSRPLAWAVAASVIAALGAGWVAVRMFETDDPLEPAAIEIATRQESAAPPVTEAEQARTVPVAPTAERRVDELAMLEDAETDRVEQLSTPPLAPERRAQSRQEHEVSVPPDAAPRAAAPAIPHAASEPANEAGAAIATAALAAPEPASEPAETDTDLQADLAPASRYADRGDRELARERSLPESRAGGTRDIDISDIVSDRTWRLVESSLRPRGSSETSPSPAAITIQASKSHLPGRAVLWVSAIVPRDIAGNPSRAADEIDLALDPALVTGHRLLASSARDVVPGTPSRAAAESAAPAATLEQVTALYEIEIRGDLDADAVLGAVRVRDGQPTKKKAESSARNISGAGVSRDWLVNSAASRLAVLGAEIATLPDDVSPTVVASLRAELERLRAESSDDDARRAGELLSVLRR
jgi:hypothetical protein